MAVVAGMAPTATVEEATGGKHKVAMLMALPRTAEEANMPPRAVTVHTPREAHLLPEAQGAGVTPASLRISPSIRQATVAIVGNRHSKAVLIAATDPTKGRCILVERIKPLPPVSRLAAVASRVRAWQAIIGAATLEGSD